MKFLVSIPDYVRGILFKKIISISIQKLFERIFCYVSLILPKVTFYETIMSELNLYKASPVVKFERLMPFLEYI